MYIYPMSDSSFDYALLLADLFFHSKGPDLIQGMVAKCLQNLSISFVDYNMSKAPHLSTTTSSLNFLNSVYTNELEY